MYLFKQNTKRADVIATNGDFSLMDIFIKAVISEELGGNFDLECSFAIKKNNLVNEFIVENAIIKVDDEYGEEYFRIVKVDKSKRVIDVYARQITITDTMTQWVEDIRPTNTNGLGALNALFTGAIGGNEVLVSSNINKNETAYFMDCNLHDAIFNHSPSFIERWGGEVHRRGYNMAINNSVGSDKGVEIKASKNLTGLTVNSNVDSLCTALKVKGYDGITVPMLYSPLKNNYGRTFFKEIKYEDVKVKGESDDEGFNTLAQAQAELTKRGKAEFSLNHIDEIKGTYAINFVELGKTEEYKNYELAESVDIGDTVTVIEPALNVNVKTRVIKRVYNCITKRRISTELSNDAVSKPVKVGDILKEFEDIKTQGNAGLGEYINAMMNSGLKDSYVVLKENELLIMDNKDINKARNVTRYNKNGLAFSTTGYYGHYEYGFTIDGKLNANRIQTGTLTAILIRSIDGGCSINLNTGEINFRKGIIRGANSSWNLDTGVFTTYSPNTTGKKFATTLSNGEIFSDDWIRLRTKQTVNIISGSVLSENEIFSIVPEGGGASTFFVDTNRKNCNIDANTLIERSLEVYGNKNCIQITKEYGKVRFYANEDINSLLTKTPIDEYTFTELNPHTGRYIAIIRHSQLIRDCINTDMDYNVWITKYGKGDIWVSATYPGYVVIESEGVAVKFKYKLEGRRKNFEEEGETKTLRKFML